MHHRPAALGHHDQGFNRGLPLLEILLGLGKLLDIVRGVLEGDELAAAGRGMGSSKARDQGIYKLRTNPGVSLWLPIIRSAQ